MQHVSQHLWCSEARLDFREVASAVSVSVVLSASLLALPLSQTCCTSALLHVLGVSSRAPVPARHWALAAGGGPAPETCHLSNAI